MFLPSHRAPIPKSEGKIPPHNVELGQPLSSRSSNYKSLLALVSALPTACDAGYPKMAYAAKAERYQMSRKKKRSKNEKAGNQLEGEMRVRL